MFILISPILIVNFVLSVIYEHTIGERLVHYQMKKDMKGSFVHDIAIVSISKNEGPYLLEWIEFHRIVGVTKFFFYDNDSDDNRSIKMNAGGWHLLTWMNISFLLKEECWERQCKGFLKVEMMVQQELE